MNYDPYTRPHEKRPPILDPRQAPIEGTPALLNAFVAGLLCIGVLSAAVALGVLITSYVENHFSPAPKLVCTCTEEK